MTVNALIILTTNDCREEWVSLPGGFTKTGSPLLVFPDKAQFNYLHVTDLHTLLQYYINVVPRSEQVSILPALYTIHLQILHTSVSTICTEQRLRI